MNQDARDLAAAKAGDAQAFARIYDRHAAVVMSLCRQCTPAPGSERLFAVDLADAEDACQETFIRAFGLLQRLPAERASSPAVLEEPSVRNNGQHRDEIDCAGGINLRPWLYAIARRVCSERRRSACRRLHHEAQAMMQNALHFADQQHLTPGSESRGTASRDELDRLSLAMDELDDRERLAIHLHYLDADPVIAAESALGLSRSAFYKLLARARQKLAAAMQPAAAHSRQQQSADQQGLNT